MVPMCEPQSDLGSAQTLGRATLNQCPMRLFAISCQYELSDQAFCTSLALQLGAPIPHALNLQEHERG